MAPATAYRHLRLLAVTFVILSVSHLNLLAVSATEKCAVPQPAVYSCGLKVAEPFRCLANGISAFIKATKNGVPALGLRRLEPLKVPKDLIIKCPKGSQTVRLTECELADGSNTIITSFSSDLKSIHYNQTNEHFELTCAYVMDERFLGAPHNSGKFVLKMPGFRAHFEINANFNITHCGKVYAGYTGGKARVLSANSTNVHFSGLSPKMNNQMNKMNMFNAIKSALEPEMAALSTELLNEWYNVFPAIADWLRPNSTSDRVPFCMQKRPNC